MTVPNRAGDPARRPFDAHAAVTEHRKSTPGFGAPSMHSNANKSAPKVNPVASNATFRIFPAGGGAGEDHHHSEVHAGERDGVKGLHVGPVGSRRFIPNHQIRAVDTHFADVGNGNVPKYEYESQRQRRADED